MNETASAVEEAPAQLSSTLAEMVEGASPAAVDAFNASLARVASYIEQTEEFVAEQAPLLVQEILRYQIISNSTWIVLGLILMAWGAYAYRWSYRGAEERLERIERHKKILQDQAGSSGDTDDVVFSVAHYGVPVSGALTAFIGICMILSNYLDVLKPWMAPRLFLVEYFRALLK